MTPLSTKTGPSLKHESGNRRQALACALLLLLCALATRPYAELAVNDEWTYLRSALDFSRTGHIVYNGWAAAILGWQLYLAGIFIKLFGFSFTVVRASTLLVAMATAFLLQRTLVRAGLRERNATIGTLTLVLSPLYLPLALSFMNDVTGLFSILLCLYCCLRALQAQTETAAIAWLAFAAAGNAVTGTARQISWLGLLVMVPCALWLLRGRRKILISGAVVWAAGVGIVLGVEHWFHHQPYTITEAFIPGRFGTGPLLHLGVFLSGFGLEAAFLLLPSLLMFVPACRQTSRRTKLVLFVLAVLCVLAGVVLLLKSHVLQKVPLPLLGNVLVVQGIGTGYPMLGTRPVVLSPALRLILTLVTIFGVVALLVSLWVRDRKPFVPFAAGVPSWRDLAILLVPFSLCYIFPLLPRAAFTRIYDRYLLALLMAAIILLLRYYQDFWRPRLPLASLLLVLVFAAYGVAATHDLFAMCRARLAAVAELEARGVPVTAIDGGWEFDAWTEMEQTGHVNDERVLNPSGAYIPLPTPVRAENCRLPIETEFAHVVPRFAVSFSPDSCLGRAPLPPVTYRTWLPPHDARVYIVRMSPYQPQSIRAN